MEITFIPVPITIGEDSSSLVVEGSIGASEFSAVFFVQQVAVTGGGSYVSIDGGRLKDTISQQSTISVGGIYASNHAFSLLSALTDVIGFSVSICGISLKHSYMSSMTISKLSDDNIGLSGAHKGIVTMSGFVR